MPILRIAPLTLESASAAGRPLLAASAVDGLLTASIGLGMQAAGVGALPLFLLADADVLLLLNLATDRHAVRPRP